MKTNRIIRHSVIFIILILLFSPNHLATAQTTWYKYPGNPVFKGGNPGEWDQKLFPSKKIIFEDNKYHMWYIGAKNNATGKGKVGYASSSDGIHWEKFEGNPLKFDCDGEGWDASIADLDILRIDSMYYMWYSAGPNDNFLQLHIGFAWSKDGISWTKYPDPVLGPGMDNDWDAAALGPPGVYYKDNQFHMWYTGHSYTIPGIKRIGYATSEDGINWKKYPGNPVIDIGEYGSWESQWIRIYSIVFNGSSYELWYAGLLEQHSIGFATSTDFINWTKCQENPVLEPGEFGTWEDWIAIGPEVILLDSVHRMWYAATNKSYRGEQIQFGYATTSLEEANAWEKKKIDFIQKEIRVKVFNREEFIKVDSLTQILPELKGEELIDAYNSLALAYSLNNQEKSYSHAEKALELADKVFYPAGEAMAYYSMGNSQYVLDNYSDALVYQLSALWIFDSLGMQYEVGNLLSQIASIHAYTGSHDLTINYHRQALEIFRELNDTASIIFTLDYLGKAFLVSGDTNNAISSHNEQLAISKKYRDLWTQAETYQALARCYSGHSLDSSIHFLDESQKIWDTLDWIRKGYNYLSKAEVYSSFGPEYYKKTEEYFLKCHEIFVFQGREKKIRLSYGLAELYLNTREYEKARKYLDIALFLCHDLMAGYVPEVFPSLNRKLEYDTYLKSWTEKVYRLYFRYDTTIHDDVAAWKHLALASEWKDNIYNEQNRRQSAMVQGQYETESSRRQIHVLEKENEVKNLTIKQSRTYLFFLIGFILILGIVTFLFFRQRKIRMEHKNLVREQKLLYDLELKNVEAEKLKELDSMKSRFFANISHEFRTPLTLIKGPLEKLLSKTNNDQDKKELSTANKYAGKLQKLINNLLTISKLESGKMQLQACETNVVKLVNNYVQAFESLANQKDIALKFTANIKELKAYIDREKFEQVLNNLLSNAFKFTDDGGSIEVAVSSPQSAVGSPQSAVDSQQSVVLDLPEDEAGSSQTGDTEQSGDRRQETEDWRLKTGDLVGPWVSIKVSDTGRGIPPDHIKHIFDRFYQVEHKDNSHYEGTGIGLALSKELVELHHGTIEVESEPGKGSTFTIKLPLGKEHLQEDEVADIQQPVSSIQDPVSSNQPRKGGISLRSTTSNQSRTNGISLHSTSSTEQPVLLIVEDNTDMRTYIRECFNTDYHIIEAIDGLDGYEKSAEHIPDVIISDVMMPRMDGVEFCKKIKTDERTSHIPVILLTARASTEYKIEGLETGADDYISKPFDPKELNVRVKNLIEQREKLRKKFVADYWKGDQSPTIQIPASDLNPMDKEFLQKAMDTVNKQLSNPEFDVNLFSQEMAMSRQQMHRKFRAVVDQSATEFIRVIRLKKAAELLSRKSGTVTEIAYDVGFSTPYYFTKTFKEQFGLTPSEYAKKYSKNHK